MFNEDDLSAEYEFYGLDPEPTFETEEEIGGGKPGAGTPTSEPIPLLSGSSEQMLRLRTGDTLQVEFVTDFNQQRNLVKVIGYVPELSILVTTPRIDRKVRLVRSGQTVNVRFMGALRLIAFRSSVLRTLFNPYPHLHLSYPKELSIVELRRNQRVALSSIIAAVKRDNGLNVPTAILDVSLGGVFLESTQRLGDIGDQITIMAKLPVAHLDRYISIKSVIRSIKHGYSEGLDRYQYGAEFLTMSPESSLVLHCFVYERIIESSCR